MDDIIVLKEYEMRLNIKNMVKQVGGYLYTENLMSNPVTIRNKVDMTEEQLNLFTQMIIQEVLNKITFEQASAEQNWQCKNGVHIVHELEKYFEV